MVVSNAAEVSVVGAKVSSVVNSVVDTIEDDKVGTFVEVCVVIN